MERAFARVDAHEIYDRTGIQFLPFNTLYQLVALEGSPLLRSAEHVLLVPDLLGFWLSGARVAEVTNASTTQLLDVRSGQWATDLVARLGIRASLLPELVEPGAVLGSVLPHVAGDTRVPAATRVVAVASHDTASAVVAVPFEPGASAAYISSGTWSLVGVELETPVVDERARLANLTNERGVSGRIRLLKNVMGLWLLQECRRAWSTGADAPAYAELVELARAAPTGGTGGPLFDPDLPALLPPGDMPGRIAALCGLGDGNAADARGTIVRAILESLACKYRFVLEEIERATGSRTELVHVVGGGAENELLCELTAEVTRRPVLAGPVEAAAVGNIALQLSAAGELGSLAEIRALVRGSTSVRAYEPAASDGGPEELYDRFLHATRPAEVAGNAVR
jgi:rhamnulokinase